MGKTGGKGRKGGGELGDSVARVADVTIRNGRSHASPPPSPRRKLRLSRRSDASVETSTHIVRARSFPTFIRWWDEHHLGGAG
jgi:hypothetical protein